MKIYKEQYNTYIDAVIEKLAKTEWIKDVENIITMARGGLILSQYISYEFDIKKVHSFGISSYENDQQQDALNIYQELTHNFSGQNPVLVVDDLFDTGRTFLYVYSRLYPYFQTSSFRFTDSVCNPKIYSAAMFVKSHAKIKPDVYIEEVPSDEWIIFPYDKT